MKKISGSDLLQKIQRHEGAEVLLLELFEVTSPLFINEKKNVLFLNCSFKSIEITSNNNQLMFEVCKIENIHTISCNSQQIKLTECTINNFQIDSSSKINKLQIYDCNIDSFSIYGGGNSELHEVIIHQRNKLNKYKIKEVRIDLSNLYNYRIENYNINWYCLSGNLAISNQHQHSKFNTSRLEFDNFKCNIDFKINFFTPTSANDSLFIKSSNMGKCILMDVNFEKEQSIHISDSNINNLKYINIQWPDKKCFWFDKDTDRQDAFRQLKRACIDNGDKLQAAVFEAYEMDEWKPTNLNDKVIKWVSRNTNYFGLHWVQPFWILTILGIIVFLSITSIEDIFEERFGHVLSFIYNPVHRTSVVFGEEVSNWTVMGDTAWKFFSGFMLFQIVSAFRKYFKK